jgi:hypothetical protein
VANNGAVVGIDTDFDCIRDINVVLRPCAAPNDRLRVDKTLGPIDDSVNIPGTSPVDGHPTGPGLDVIDTEIVAMCLTGSGITLAAGTGGPSALPLQPSLGTVAEDLSTPDPSLADSTFNVLFEVSGIPGGPLYNQIPLPVRGRINCLPPAANYSHPTGICLPLTTAGTCNGGANDGNACINDLDCPGGACGGTIVLANLVSANHSVNQTVCDDSPFPVCGGDCPADEVCTPDAANGACFCAPELVACDQSDPATCGGFCTGTNEVCSIGPVGLCECIPGTFAGGAVPDGAIVPGIPLTLQRATTEAVGDITLSWGASCSPTDDDYEIYEGLIPGFYNHTSRFCSTGGATTITFTPLAGDTYYLVVPRNPLREGSYGKDTSLTERPQGGPACLPQLIGTCP